MTSIDKSTFSNKEKLEMIGGASLALSINKTDQIESKLNNLSIGSSSNETCTELDSITQLDSMLPNEQKNFNNHKSNNTSEEKDTDLDEEKNLNTESNELNKGNPVIVINKGQISTSLREKLGKAIKKSNDNKKLVSTNSEQLMQPKNRKLSTLLRFSSQNVSFFSRSFGTDDSLCVSDSNHESKENNAEKSLTEELDKTSRQTLLAKSFLQFTSKVVKSKKKNDSENSSSASIKPDLASDTAENPSSNLSKIGNYVVDYEKLVKELAQPSVNNPLTSFKQASNDKLNKMDDTKSLKPPLKSSKTLSIDNSPSCSKKITRSLTQDKAGL